MASPVRCDEWSFQASGLRFQPRGTRTGTADITIVGLPGGGMQVSSPFLVLPGRMPEGQRLTPSCAYLPIVQLSFLCDSNVFHTKIGHSPGRKAPQMQYITWRQ